MKTVKVAGVNAPVPVTTTIQEFCEVAAKNRICVMLIKTRDYIRTKQEVFDYFAREFSRDWSYQKAATSAKLVCRGCKTDFPHSYLLSLEKELGPDLIVHGANAGFEDFGQSGNCPKCGSRESFYVYDNLLGEEITKSDADALVEYWRYLAKQWWQTTSPTEACCDGCTGPLRSGDGYKIGSRIYCEECAFNPDPYESLRENPNFFGVDAVRKAKLFASGNAPFTIEIVDTDDV